MNLNETPQTTERVGIGKRIAELWNTRISRIIVFATAGLVLNCCCVIVPLMSR